MGSEKWQELVEKDSFIPQKNYEPKFGIVIYKPKNMEVLTSWRRKAKINCDLLSLIILA